MPRTKPATMARLMDPLLGGTMQQRVQRSLRTHRSCLIICADVHERASERPGMFLSCNLGFYSTRLQGEGYRQEAETGEGQKDGFEMDLIGIKVIVLSHTD